MRAIPSRCTWASSEWSTAHGSSPTARYLPRLVTAPKLWATLRDYLAREYDHTPELRVGGKKHGWCYRYRRRGRTLVTLYPEHDGFTVLVVLGKSEADAATRVMPEQSARVRAVFSEARQSTKEGLLAT